MVLGGVTLGLAIAGLIGEAPMETGPDDAPLTRVQPDRYAEARRSQEMREGQPSALGDGPGLAVTDGLRVIDGDTFHYRGKKIRVADIDTPEMRGRCPYESELAARATARMRELLHAGPFELERIPGRDEDRYGRKLRVVTRNGRSLGDQLVAEGLAQTWSGRREPWCD
jgi:endonuclease YncB( thermonuclease family)